MEPEWLNSDQIYINGFSTSLPEQTQIESLRQIPAFEKIELLRPGYAIEYDCMSPSQLKATLESKQVSGLFFAGQINGTSGYEEAAAQGLIAGINSARKGLGKLSIYLNWNLFCLQQFVLFVHLTSSQDDHGLHGNKLLSFYFLL